MEANPQDVQNRAEAGNSAEPIAAPSVTPSGSTEISQEAPPVDDVLATFLDPFTPAPQRTIPAPSSAVDQPDQATSPESPVEQVPPPVAPEPTEKLAPASEKPKGERPEKRESLWEIRAQTRRERIRQLLPRRLTVHEMAKALGVGDRVVYKDLKIIRREMAESLTSTSVLDIAADVIRTSEVLEREAFASLITRPGKEGPPLSERVAVWNFIRQQKRDTVRILQSLGVAFKAPEKVQIQHVAMERINALKPEVQEQIANTTDPAEFERLLAQHIGPELAAQFMGKPIGALGPGADEEIVDAEITEAEEGDGDPE